MAVNPEKGGRHNHFLGKWLREFGWLQMRGSGDDLVYFEMICKDCTKEECPILDIEYYSVHLLFCSLMSQCSKVVL